MSDRIAEIEARLAKGCRPGIEWYAVGGLSEEEACCARGTEPDVAFYEGGTSDDPEGEAPLQGSISRDGLTEAQAALIAHAPADLRYLLAELKRLRGEVTP